MNSVWDTLDHNHEEDRLAMAYRDIWKGVDALGWEKHKIPPIDNAPSLEELLFKFFNVVYYEGRRRAHS